MSADLLRRAAQKLREHDQAIAEIDTFTYGTPWTVEEEDDSEVTLYVVAERGEQFSASYIGEGFLSRAHADYVALMHPPVANAIAEMLDEMVQYTESALCNPEWPPLLCAVSLAEAIVRERAS